MNETTARPYGDERWLFAFRNSEAKRLAVGVADGLRRHPWRARFVALARWVGFEVLALKLSTRMHTCVPCGRDFLLDRWTVPPKGLATSPICSACRPEWVRENMRRCPHPGMFPGEACPRCGEVAT
jgi:hypothetical protein